MNGLPPGWPEPQFGLTRPPEPAIPPTMADIVKLAEGARIEFLAERLRLEHAITKAIEGAGLTTVRTEPVEQVAAHPAAIHRLRTEIFQLAVPVGQPGQIGRLTDLPLVPDGTLLPGEIHLRPHPHQHPDDDAPTT